MTTKKPRPAKPPRPPRINEKDGTALQCRQFLELEGWRVTRVQADKPMIQCPKCKHPIRAWQGHAADAVDEGHPDYLVVRTTPVKGSMWNEVFYLETKAQGEELRPSQALYGAALRKAGYLVCVADSLAALQVWLKERERDDWKEVCNA